MKHDFDEEILPFIRQDQSNCGKVFATANLFFSVQLGTKPNHAKRRPRPNVCQLDNNVRKKGDENELKIVFISKI
ncbi:hypothetical protein BLOT_010356 [Blomia tropicalis]|nr:hypothetical protein BLOT_010356 [Blomia tropicalis]